MASIDDDLPPADPAASLRMIDEQRAVTERSLSVNPLVYYGPWGVAWLVGFGLLFLRYGPDGRVFVDLPDWLPLTVLFVLLVAAWLITVILPMRIYRHLQGPSSFQGAAYGIAWFLAYMAMGITLGRFADLVPEPQQGLMWASISIGIAGPLYVAGAAVWHDRQMFVLGVWTTVVNIAGVIAGPGWHSLLICLLGGGGLLAFGGVGALRHRRARR